MASHQRSCERLRRQEPYQSCGEPALVTVDSGLVARVLHPERLFNAAEVTARPSPVPARPGVYGWYFSEVPPSVPTDQCHWLDGKALLYVGISPKAPPTNGRPASRQTLRNRPRTHYTGNAEGSTL